MAINYDGAGGIFTECGGVIARINEFDTFIVTTLPAGRSALGGVVSSKYFALPGIGTLFDSQEAALDSSRRDFAAFVNMRLQDYSTVLLELGVPSSDMTTVLRALRRKMLDDAETVQAGSTSVGAASAHANNIGDGTIVATKMLDGYNAPGSYFPADQTYAGVDSEFMSNETLVVECTNDSQRSGGSVAEGSEPFRIRGLVTNGTSPTPYWLPNIRGNGVSADNYLLCGQGQALQTTLNGDFESWTTGPPDTANNWSVLSGLTWGTEVERETTTVYRGSNALAINGDGTTATVGVHQTLSLSAFYPLRLYRVFCRYRATATAASGTFQVLFTGTGYSAGSSEKLEVAGGSLPTSWTLGGFWIVLPEQLPSDWRLEVRATGTLTAGRTIYVDDVFVVPATYFGGVAFAIAPGATPWMAEDRVSFAITNDFAGKFQKFWIRWFGRQLPSSGSPTISDSLVA